jgi:poly(hydroxyalkanoate) granule-associated protein
MDATTPSTTPPAATPLVDRAAGTTNALVERAAEQTTGMVDRAAGAAKSAERTLTEQGRAALDLGHDVVRAGLGAVSVAGEQGARLFDTLVDRGARVEAQGLGRVRERVRETVEEVKATVTTRQQQAQARVGDLVEDGLTGPLGGAMRRLGVPTRAEVRELATSVAQLSARVETLIARMEAAQAAQPAAAPTTDQ